MARRYYSSTAVATTLSGNINNSTTSITVAALSGYPAQTPFTAIIDPDTASEEVVTVTGVAGTTLTVTRGSDGTSAVSHNAGAVFRHGVSARDFDEANDHINSSSDVHTQYVAKALISGTKGAVPVGTGSTVAALSPGANGEVLYADSSATNGLRWQPVYNAGRNRIINGGFDLWQRSTSYTINSPVGYVYGAADRWKYYHNGSTVGTNVVSREAFTVGQTDVPGEPTYFHRITTTTLGTGQTYFDITQDIEDVRTFAGQTVTVSLYARSSGSRNLSIFLSHMFGSGGSAQVDTTVRSAAATTTGWVRYTHTVTLPSISGKTIGTGSALRLIMRFSSPGAGETHDIACVQLETGPVATPFEFEPYEATLRKCQRYYYRVEPGASGRWMGVGYALLSTRLDALTAFPVTMRVRPTALEQSGTASHYQINYGGGGGACSAVPAYNANTTQYSATTEFTVASGLTQGQGGAGATNNTAAYLAWSAEL